MGARRAITIQYVVADVSMPVLPVSRLLRVGYATVLTKGNSYLQPSGAPYKWPVWMDGNRCYLCPLCRLQPGKRTLYISPIRNEKSDYWKLGGEILIRAHVKLRRGALLTHKGVETFLLAWDNCRLLVRPTTPSPQVKPGIWMTHGYFHPLPTGHLSLSGLGRLIFALRT